MLRTLLLPLLLAGFALSGQAATITVVGDTVIMEGDTVTYEYSISTNTTSGALGLFGTPGIVGDMVQFVPPDFSASSKDGTGSGFTTANFIFDRVYSHDQSAINLIEVYEFGDYEITNGDSVSADLYLQAISNVGPGFTFSTDSFDSTNASGLGLWDMTAIIDPALAMGEYSRDMTVSIQNTLEAFTDAPGEVAWIQKKVNFTATTVVPVPAAAWLFGSALLALGAIKRKRAH